MAKFMMIAVLLCLAAFAVAQEDGKKKTWAQVSACMKQVKTTCLKKFPKTPKCVTHCFFNKTITDAFDKAEAPFEKCIDEHLKTGTQCLRSKHRHHSLGDPDTSLDLGLNADCPHHTPEFLKCVMYESRACEKGCLMVSGQKSILVKGCAIYEMGGAFKLFGQCWRGGHHEPTMD